jgi:benzodiazapine receptor
MTRAGVLTRLYAAADEGVHLSYTTSTRRPDLQRPRRRPATRDVAMLVVFLLISFAVAAFGSIVSVGQINGWYADAPHVTWTPPGWLFGVVWTVLYALIAVSGWLLWMRRARSALTFFVAQLVVNAVWTPVFFGGYPILGPSALWIGVAIIIVLDLLVVTTVASAWQVSRAAALLLVPYLVWLLYASTLNWGDAVLISLA